jgi:hypothetical protein
VQGSVAAAAAAQQQQQQQQQQAMAEQYAQQVGKIFERTVFAGPDLAVGRRRCIDGAFHRLHRNFAGFER